MIKAIKHLIFKFIVLLWTYAPFKTRLKSVIKKNPSIFEKLYKDLRFKGIMDIEIDDNKHFKLYNLGFTTIENEIFWKGIHNGWEKVSINLWIKCAKEANVILDIGANTGVYSLIASAINNKAEVFSFEPVKRTAEIFKKNIDLNPTFKIYLVEKAVSNKEGEFTMYDMPTKSQYSASLNEKILRNETNKIK